MIFRPIYLHYLDRELGDALQYRPAVRDVLAITQTLLWATPSPLYCGFATNWELEAQIGEFGPYLSALVSARHLDLPCHYGNVADFIASMQEAYGHNAEQHPEYFDEDLIARIGLTPTHAKGTSATRDLARALREWSQNGMVGEGSRMAAERVLRVKGVVGEALSRHQGEALRFPYFRGFFAAAHADNIVFWRILRRQLSTEYTRHYLAWTQGDIATGIPQLTDFDCVADAFPFHDLPILDLVLSRCGMDVAFRERMAVSPAFLAQRGQDLHRRFCCGLRVFLAGTVRALGLHFPIVATQRDRAPILETARLLLNAAGDVGRSKRNDVTGVLDHALNLINTVVSVASRNPAFLDGVETMSQSFHMQRERIVIVVATDREQDTIIRSIFSDGAQIHRRYIGNQTFIELGTIGGCDLSLVRSEMGSGGISGSQNTVGDAIRALAPSAVIMVGIAYGLKRHEQQLGDILISKQMAPYELQRVSPCPGGKYKIIPRYDRPSASPRLLDRFRDGQVDWGGAAIHYGLIMSGEKLSDSKEFCDELLGIESEAIGGEMEGAGLYAASAREGTEWIIVKGICDWGYDKDDANQKRASQNAVDFLLHVVRLGGLAGHKTLGLTRKRS